MTEAGSRMNRVVLALSAAVALSAAPAAVAGGKQRQAFDYVPKDAATAKRLAIVGHARSLVDRATERLYFAHTECVPPATEQATITSDAPAAATIEIGRAHV